LGSCNRRILNETAGNLDATQNDAFFSQDRYYTKVHITQLLKIIVAMFKITVPSSLSDINTDDLDVLKQKRVRKRSLTRASTSNEQTQP